MRHLVAAIGLVILAAGCAGSRRVGPPPNPPKLPRPLQPGPPAAWAETKAGSRWLGYSTFCWPDTVCADYGLGRCGDRRHSPLLHVRASESIRFHLGFEPKTVSLYLYGDPHARPLTQVLDTSRTPNWRVTREGQFVLAAKSKSGHASYVGCLRFT
jgi:hypothetical protein